jgi:ABC-type bacteriocin/lantibiotic exporter with double-glycine peptidase domain
MQLLYAMEREKDNGTLAFHGIKKSLEFKKFTFIYPNTTREVLKSINIEVKK